MYFMSNAKVVLIFELYKNLIIKIFNKKRGAKYCASTF